MRLGGAGKGNVGGFSKSVYRSVFLISEGTAGGKIIGGGVLA